MIGQNSKIKAVVFDCFGVLATDGWLPFKDKYFRYDPTLFAKATKLNKMVDAGLESYDNFIKEIADMAGLGTDETRDQIENNIPNEELLNYISKYLKPSYKLGILSNSGSNWLGDIFTQEQIKLFDAAVLSFEIGAIKPDPVMYTTISKKLNLEPDECIFIDDQERYCDGAREVGMEALKYIDPKKLARDLTAVLDIS